MHFYAEVSKKLHYEIGIFRVKLVVAVVVRRGIRKDEIVRNDDDYGNNTRMWWGSSACVWGALEVFNTYSADGTKTTKDS